jgi:hypothetical protein
MSAPKLSTDSQDFLLFDAYATAIHKIYCPNIRPHFLRGRSNGSEISDAHYSDGLCRLELLPAEILDLILDLVS